MEMRDDDESEDESIAAIDASRERRACFLGFFLRAGPPAPESPARATTEELASRSAAIPNLRHLHIASLIVRGTCASGQPIVRREPRAIRAGPCLAAVFSPQLPGVIIRHWR